MTYAETYADLLQGLGVTIAEDTLTPASRDTVAELTLDLDPDTGAWSGDLKLRSDQVAGELDHVTHTAYRIMRRLNRGGPPPPDWTTAHPTVALTVDDVFPPFTRA